MNEANAMLQERVWRKLITIMCRRKKARMQTFDHASSGFWYSPAGDSWVTDLVG